MHNIKNQGAVLFWILLGSLQKSSIGAHRRASVKGRPAKDCSFRSPLHPGSLRMQNLSPKPTTSVQFPCCFLESFISLCQWIQGVKCGSKGSNDNNNTISAYFVVLCHAPQIVKCLKLPRSCVANGLLCKPHRSVFCALFSLWLV